MADALSGQPIDRSDGARAASLVVAFDSSSRRWLTAADRPVSGRGTVVDVPSFAGELLTDDESLAAASADFGHILVRRPGAVLRAASADDVVAMVGFARRHAIQVAARGQGHSVFGQAQAEAGVVIDMSSLAAIGDLDPSGVLLGAGVSWRAVVRTTLPLGLSPPTLTDYLDLSVGGTLSVGGIGGQTFAFGAQTDNVTLLEVVTGAGDRVVCSPSERPDLFDACRAGLGQFGVIVAARVRLVTVPPHVRVYTAGYHDLAAFVADQERLVDQRRFDYVAGFAVPAEQGWSFLLEAARSFIPGAEPDDAALVGGLSFVPGTLTTEDRTALEFAERLDPVVAEAQAARLWDAPHPWLNLLVPAEQAVAFVTRVLRALPPEDVGGGPVLLSPLRRHLLRTPFLAVPDVPRSSLFALLRYAVPPTAERAADLVAANRRLFEEARAVGATRYPVGAVPMGPGDWRRQLGPMWDRFVEAKRRYDPDGVLTPGVGVFLSPDPGLRWNSG